MQYQRGRLPYGINQQQIGTLCFGIVVIIIIIYLLYQTFFKGGYYSQRSSLAATSQINLPNTSQTSNWNSYNYPSQSSSNMYDSSTFNSYDYPNQNSLTTSEKNDILTGYWILFDTNGVITQFNLNANDYTFIQRLIQNDNKGIPKNKIFLVENGRTRQYIVSNELYTIIANMNYIVDSRTVNNSMNSSSNGLPSSTPNSFPSSSTPNSYPNSSTPNSSTPNSYPNSSTPNSFPNSSTPNSFPNSSTPNTTYNQGIKP